MLQVQLVFNQFLRNGSNGNSEDEIWKPAVTIEILEKQTVPRAEECMVPCLKVNKIACLKAVFGQLYCRKSASVPSSHPNNVEH